MLAERGQAFFEVTDLVTLWEALTKESSTEKVLSKIYKEYSKEHDDELDDIYSKNYKYNDDNIY